MGENRANLGAGSGKEGHCDAPSVRGDGAAPLTLGRGGAGAPGRRGEVGPGCDHADALACYDRADLPGGGALRQRIALKVVAVFALGLLPAGVLVLYILLRLALMGLAGSGPDLPPGMR